MKILFNYRPDGKTIKTKSGDKKLMVIRQGPRGIIAMVGGHEPIVIWDKDKADAHVNDSETKLKKRVVTVLNANS